MDAPTVEGLRAALDLVCARATEPASDFGLMRMNEALAMLRRRVDAASATVAADIARASRPELGNAGLARSQGFRSPVALIAAAAGGSRGDAARLVAVGEATAPRPTLGGKPAPAQHPVVAEALAAGRLSVAAAAGIVAALDPVATSAGPARIAQGEALLVREAQGLSLDQVEKLLPRVTAWLDPDGVAPREDELRAARGVGIRENRDGSVQLTAVLDPETAAPVTTAIQAMVGVAIRRRAEALDGSRGQSGVPDDRSIPQLQADALAAICRHALGCDGADVPTDGATVVVRVTLEELESDRGAATIDGVSAPVSIGTARRMAAAGRVIPWVLGGDNEILDFGRSRRLFTRAQKLALTERDGGCAMCGAPPGMTQVHHLRWWTRDAGPTDLANGILLCTRCHHRIHDDGWEIRIEGASVTSAVWFVPPRHVDPERVPRPGHRVHLPRAA